MADLNDKQQRFVDEYLIDANATQAAIRAGYSDKTAKQIGSRLLTNVDIRARIEEQQQKRADKLQLDAEWVLQRLKDISDRCLQTEPVTKWDYSEKKLVETGEYMFDSQGANKATELIGKHLGMFKEKVEHSGEVNMIKVTLPTDLSEDDG